MPQPVTVDFLIPPNDKMNDRGAIHHIESDLAAIVTPGLELAFQDRYWKELSGPHSSGASASRSIPVCGPGAFTVLKALAFGNRTENKDAYDLSKLYRVPQPPHDSRRSENAQLESQVIIPG